MTKSLTNHKSKLSILERVIIFLVVFFYFCDFILYIGYINEESIINQKNVTLGLFVPLFLLLLVKKRIKLSSLLRKPLIHWTLLYFVLSIYAFIYALIFNLNEQSAFGAFRTVILSVIIIVLLTGFLEDYQRFRFARKCMIGGMLFSVLMNILGFLQIIILSKSVGRAAGFFINPNSAGITLCLGLVLVTQTISARWRTIFIFVIGVGIVLTFSRAAALFYILYVLYFIFIQGSLSLNKKLVTIFFIVALLGIFSNKILTLFKAQESLNENVMNRVALITDPLQNQSDITEDARIGILKVALERFTDKPIFGGGLGASGRIIYHGEAKGTHNQYLAFLLDFGIMGGLVFIYYFMALWKNRVRGSKVIFRDYVLALLFFSLFSHNLFEEYSMLFIHSFAWVLLTSGALVLPKRIKRSNSSLHPVKEYIHS